ncbi:coproporphyrinogen III oxidase [Nosocomiicoccus sp. HMSC067E10]|uniref:radical SAM family heme chaperone HemW n=1 Tax=Nosocomiicoccus sp. HMSC067E10 TaxID=1739271 RepID=UPI0008A3C435|nr:radical SAM family heme chaperone HemW [Nosocomiicoccus sp. HMSC067E10]OFL47114.1 coproporphyrinogen III oxidase [Nosocomiicoccus sp. HMSC067E10]
MDSLYIHIPFCNRICAYCDFNKFLIDNQPVDTYVDMLIKELKYLKERSLKTIYVGGGTPTALNLNQLERLLSFINDNFNVSHEYTFEANPDELTTEKISLLKEYGVNRVSLGVQTFDNELLKILGRTHNFDDIYRSINHMEKIGLDNYSIDLMYNLPGETSQHIEDSLNNIKVLQPKHISWYSLIIEKHTIFYNKIKQGKLHIANSEVEGKRYERVMEGLKEIGYHQYEISNFSSYPKYESMHNKTYWKNNEYYGAGAGSHGYVNGERYFNVKPVPHYINRMKEDTNAIKEIHKLTNKEMYEEEMFLNLRLNKGLKIKQFKDKYGVSLFDIYGDVIEKHINQNNLQINGEYLSLTEQGKMVGNDVFIDFLID